MNPPSAHSLSAPRRRVTVGMSGGVDSSVAALLLQQQNYEVRGLFMRNWQETDPGFPCTAAEDARDALAVCERIGIELDAVDFSAEYWQRVFSYFLEEHRRGRTPNPDVLCNREIKFRAFLDHATTQGAEWIATGHYARVRLRDGRFELLKARDLGKDQSYFLHTLGQQQLSRSLFPLGELAKAEVRLIAARAGFANAAKKDSTGICFIGERDFNRFLSRYLPAQPGEIETADGERVGRHNGLMYYTLGQRKGIGIGGRRNAAEQPWYVVDKDLERNVLVVAQGHDHPRLYSRGLVVPEVHWIAGKPPPLALYCHAKTRYRQSDQACVVHALDDGYRVEFAQPQRAITPGQSVVFYQDDVCLGGGVIRSALR